MPFDNLPTPPIRIRSLWQVTPDEFPEPVYVCWINNAPVAALAHELWAGPRCPRFAGEVRERIGSPLPPPDEWLDLVFDALPEARPAPLWIVLAEAADTDDEWETVQAMCFGKRSP